VLFTGERVQLTVMSLAPGEEIGLEMHSHLDQFLRIEQGTARVTLGPSRDEIAETHEVADDWAVIVPGGTWHNVINTGDADLKLYSLYAPPEHPDGTVHRTKADADEAAHHD
jgi:mannose-6-phosphate isomerase-like protein (cupin superfamily)